MNRKKLIKLVEENLLSTEQVAKMLDVTKTRLNRIKELKVVVRGYYLKEDVVAYLNDEEIQQRRMKHQKRITND